ncbi:prolyl oligopeptidase family serine peptidase [bacterium]|nr:prolyl oligopeptidase family serine peptidase [bacterium]
MIAWLFFGTLLAGDPSLSTDDPHLWLEEIEGEKALAWVRERNAQSLARLESDPRFPKFFEQIQTILEDKERIPMGELHGPWVYNFWQDADHVRGIWRRTTRESYREKAPTWEIVLDVDQLAKSEGENWVFQGDIPSSDFGDFSRAMIATSRGGSDATVWREFDLKTQSFPKDGFVVPQAKTRLAWADDDELLIGTDVGEGSLTTSGYPRLIKRWKRGTPLADAPTIFECAPEHVSASISTSHSPMGRIRILSRAITFFETENFLLDDQGKIHPIQLPRSAELAEAYGQHLYFLLRDPLERPGLPTIRQGSLVRLNTTRLDMGPSAVETIWEPSDRQSIQSVSASKSFLNVSILDNVEGQIWRIKESEGSFDKERIDLPANGAVGIVSAMPDSDDLFVTHTGFLNPTTLYEVTEDRPTEVRLIKQLSAKFDASGLIVDREEAISADGTKIPYFLVRPSAAKKDGSLPTLLYGYGGFEVPMLPSYGGATGKVWMEPGGAFVLACIRGGGEFGPAWHRAALGPNRPRAYEDFVAVAEDLIKRGWTSPRRLGISGASNGGLLVGAAFTRRPDLFHAVVCGVPLLDMLRYSKLLAGASWIGEYGDPDNPAEREALLGYSPYHHVRAGVKYPEVFFQTSTKDDRVHPGHARKMVARMIEQGHPVFYFENIEGGHGAASNLKQRARRTALEMTYLHQKLFD